MCYEWQNSCQSQSDILCYFNIRVFSNSNEAVAALPQLHLRSSFYLLGLSVGFENNLQLLFLAFVSVQRMPIDTSRPRPFEPFWYTWFSQWEKCKLFSARVTLPWPRSRGVLVSTCWSPVVDNARLLFCERHLELLPPPSLKCNMMHSGVFWG